MTIAIIGTGNMANALEELFKEKHTVNVYGRDKDEAKEVAQGSQGKGEALGEEIEGEIVILALPYSAMPDVLTKYENSLKDKILVDISNPVDFENLMLVTPENSSWPQELRKQFPWANIVKAFNTTLASTLPQKEVDGKPLDVFIAGKDESKEKVKELVESVGLRVVNIGGLENAYVLEVLGLAHMMVQAQFGSNWNTALKILP